MKGLSKARPSVEPTSTRTIHHTRASTTQSARNQHSISIQSAFNQHAISVVPIWIAFSSSNGSPESS